MAGFSPAGFCAGSSGSGVSSGVSGSGSLPVQALILVAHTGQAVFTAPATHFSVQVQVAGCSWVVWPSSINAIRSASSTWFKKWTAKSEEHTSELQSRFDLVCRLLLENTKQPRIT